MSHITVLQDEAIESLALTRSSVIVDATLGAGGHARAILKELDSSGTFIGLDADPAAIAEAKVWSESVDATVHLAHANFRQLEVQLERFNVTTVDAILADLGWRMEQFTDSGKGFSFLNDEPLLMTYGDPGDYPFTADDIVNTWAEENIANVLYGYGEERAARKIATAIVTRRATTPISTAAELAHLIEGVVRQHPRIKTHPATRSFQALRIAVNDEFSALEEFLHKALTALAPGGRLAVISFHSMEDRIVKHTFRSFAHDHQAVLCSKKPIIATLEEVRENPRARSAKLRTIEKLKL